MRVSRKTLVKANDLLMKIAYDLFQQLDEAYEKIDELEKKKSNKTSNKNKGD